MVKLGLIAGIGVLPVEFLRAAHVLGHQVVVITVVPDANPALKEEADAFYDISPLKVGKIFKTLKKEGVTDITMLGKVTKEVLYKRGLTIPDMKKRFGLPVGLSDHTLGSVVPLTAVVLGAEVVEKHFILDRSLGGADSAFSMEPAEFRQMVNDIRNAETSLGQVKYEITEQERLKRRSLYAVEDIKKGDIFTSSNVRSLRPGYGLSPFFYEKLLGKESVRNIKRGEPLTSEDLC